MLKTPLVFNNKKIIDYHCKLEYNSEHEQEKDSLDFSCGLRHRNCCLPLCGSYHNVS